MQARAEKFALQGIRVLDFTGELGPYAAKLYVGLGADVIHMEPVGGDPLRQVGPFYHDVPGPEASLPFLYYNAGKRGLSMDLSRKRARTIFRKLCKQVDVLIESCVPGYLDGLGLSYPELSKDNPRLVQASITPFGSQGPYKDYPGSDLTCSAMGGFLYLAGVDGEKSVRTSDDQAYRMAEGYAAVGSLVAYLHAQRAGQGQWVDVSCMESVGMALENAIQYYDLEGKIRRGRGREAGTATIHPCRDGFIALVAIMGENKVMWDPFVQWMKDEDVEGWQELDDPRWIKPNYRSSAEGYEKFCRIFEAYSMQHDKRYLYETGQAHRTAVSPVSNGKDLLNNPQLQFLDFWKKLHHPELGGEVTYPGAPYELGNSSWTVGAPAPALGQHTAEILKGLGYRPALIQTLAKEGVIHVK